LAEVIKFIWVELDTHYFGLGQRMTKLLSYDGNENPTEISHEDEREHLLDGTLQRHIEEDIILPIFLEPMPLSIRYKPMASGFIGRIGLGMLQYTIVDLPLQAFFLSRVVGRIAIKEAGLPGILGLSGWGAFGQWLLQVEWFTALGFLFREVQGLVLSA